MGQIQVWLRILKTCLHMGPALFAVGCRAEPPPCDAFVRVDVPTQQRMIWVCATTNWTITADPSVATEETRPSPRRRVVTAVGIGRVRVGDRHVVELSKHDVAVDGVSMGKERHAAIDATGTVILGAFIRDFD